MTSVRLWHRLWHGGFWVDPAAASVVGQWARIPLAKALSNRKRPAGEAGRFWGYYREERRSTRQV
jgi:hypothetical protein